MFKGERIKVLLEEKNVTKKISCGCSQHFYAGT